jgi:putative FmdB family regulatory protein
MPIYEYACTSCGERTEAKQGFDDPPLEKCPHCGGKLRKLYSPVGIVFKGSGFYSTDQKGKKGSGGTESKTSESKTSETASKGDGTKKADASKAETKSSSTSTEKSA